MSMKVSEGSWEEEELSRWEMRGWLESLWSNNILYEIVKEVIFLKNEQEMFW